MFVSFMEAYYEWLETTGDVGAFSGGLDLLSQRDIDSTFDDFVKYFRKEFLLSFPEKMAVDSAGNPLNQRTLIKNIRQFFRAKGSEKSYEFLFRILYNSSVEFYYPKEDVLRLSDGKWVERLSIKTTANNGTALFDLIQQEIKQRNTSGTITAYARVTDVQIYAVDGVEIAELFLSGMFGTFDHTRNIEGTTPSGNLLKELVYPVIASISVKEGGQDYQPGETLYLKNADGTKNPTGFGFLARVEEVDTINSLYKTDEEIQLGSIKQLRIVDFGFNYASLDDWKIIVDTPFGSGASFDIELGGVSRYPGYYEGTDGQLSSQKKLQDSHYYQQFSYVLKVESSYDNWIDTIKKIIHPAGMEVFGEVLLYRRRIDTIDVSHNELRVYENPLIGHYTPYTFNTYENLRNNSVGVDLYPQGYNPYACSISGSSGAGTVPESGTTQHNPYDVPLGKMHLAGPLDTNITDIFGHNAHCPDFDINNHELGTAGCSGGWSPCDQTPFAIADDSDNTTSVTGGYGCCNSDYWIIYPHANSRGIDYIPPTLTVKRLWFWNSKGTTGSSLDYDQRASYPFEVHERVHQVKKDIDLDFAQVTGSDLRPYINRQDDVEVGTIYDIQWYEEDSSVQVTGSGDSLVTPDFRLDVYSETDNFMGSSYESGITGYFLESQYSKMAIYIGDSSQWADWQSRGGRDSNTETSEHSITANITIETKVIPNPFIHIIINDFLHMPIDSGTTGSPYQYKSTTNHDLAYQQVR